MADTKITALAPIGAIDPANDVLPIVDVSNHSMAASGTTCRVTTNQLLQANAIASLASATISGDLTVRTDKLAVTSTGVGCGIASPTEALHVNKSSGTGVFIRLQDSANSNYIGTDNGNFRILNGTSPVYDLLNIQQLGVFTFGDGAGGTRMTLNSTGLGVGTTDTTNGRFNVRAGTGATGNSAFFSNSDGTYNPYLQIQHSSEGIKLFVSSAYGTPSNNLIFGNGGVSETMRIDGSGNVGIGVTPSAWGIYKGLQVGYASLAGYAGSDTLLGSNVYFDGGAFKYIAAGLASSYRQLAGGHQWSTAVAGANPGDPLTLLPQMTLDASGNLILQSSATPATLTTNGQLTVNATSNTNLRFSYRGSDGVTRTADLTLA